MFHKHLVILVFPCLTSRNVYTILDEGDIVTITTSSDSHIYNKIKRQETQAHVGIRAYSLTCFESQL
jgi:hypothetical protein